MAKDRKDDGLPAGDGSTEAPATETGGAGEKSPGGRKYDVGYGKPPRKNQFQKGQSGNPKGRPKGARGLRTELREEMSERVEISENGKRRKVSKLRLTVKALTAKAAKGDVRAADRLIALFISVFGIEDERDAKRGLSETDQAILDRILSDEEPSDDDE